MLSVSNLSASYNGILALDRVSMNVREGEMVALIGSNGAGKSTLLNCISGIVRPSGGSVRFEGDDLVGRPAYSIARLGLLQVPEGRQILSDLSVLENLQLGNLALGKRERRYDLDDVLTLFPILSDRRNQQAGSLSGGQQQMLALGRSLMGSPRMLLLDEPSLGLSPLITDEVFRAIQKLNATGMTVVLVEQNAKRALEITTRTYVLERGRVAMEGLSSAIADDPEVIRSYLG